MLPTATDAGAVAKLLEDGHDGHLLALEVLRNRVPEHEVLERELRSHTCRGTRARARPGLPAACPEP